MGKEHLLKILDKYFSNNIPFVLYRYPNQPITLIAQYSGCKPIKSIADVTNSFVIHPFIASHTCPIVQIKAELRTSNFGSVVLDDIPVLEAGQPLNFCEVPVTKGIYLNSIQQYKNSFKSGNLKKVIYSRIVEFDALPKKQLLNTFLKMEAQYKNAFCYLFQIPGNGIWFGATPEKLLSYKNEIATTVALAGTKTKETTANKWGAKEMQEQDIVSNYILELIKRFNLNLKNKSVPETIEAGHLNHLKTAFEIEIPVEKVFDFLSELHPTPAVGGYPKDAALQLIQATEPYDRQYYTGYLGYIKNAANFDFYVNLRCAKSTGKNVLAFVGGGITAGSVPELEWGETINKSKTIRLVCKGC